MTTRGDQTRQHLLDTAEQLFASRGFQAVSLREIRIAAGARNTAAMQFHFGDRDGLVDALMERHLTRIGARQQELFDRYRAEGSIDDPRRLVEVLVRPGAEYLTLGPSERAWVKIMAELSTLPDLSAPEMRAAAPFPALEVGAILLDRLRESMPNRIAERRMVLLAQTAVQLSGVRARLVDESTTAHAPLPMAVFIENLIDMIHGALFAPVSDATLQAVEDVESDITVLG